MPQLFPSVPPELAAAGAPGSFNDEFSVRSIVGNAIRNSGKSREVIAEEMTYLLGATVTRRALDSYTSESEQQNRFPAQYMRAFCHVTSDWTLVCYVTERSGFHPITAPEKKLLDLGRHYIAQKRAASAMNRLEAELAEVAL